MGFLSPPSTSGVSKRLRTEEQQPNELTTDNQPAPPEIPSSTTPLPQPRFIIMHATGNQQLGKVSPFFLQKLISSLAGEPKSIQKLRSGDLLIETTGPSQSRTLLNTKAIGGLAIEVTPHATLNSSRGVISEFDLMSVSESEIVSGLQDQGVTAVRRITMRKDGIQVPTKHLILTFNTPRLPNNIKAGYLNCPVRPYIPNPMRCFQCQKYGHSKTSCRSSAACARCSVVGHDSEGCTVAPCCTNCKGNHPAYARSCPKWQEEKEVQRLKVTNNISFAEARRLVAPSEPRKHPSYAAAVKSTSSVEVQTNISVPPKDSFAPLAKYLLSSTAATTSEQSTSTAISVKAPTDKPAKQSAEVVRPSKNDKKKVDTSAASLKPQPKQTKNTNKLTKSNTKTQRSTPQSISECSSYSDEEVKKSPRSFKCPNDIQESSDSSCEEGEMEVDNPRPAIVKTKRVPIKLKRDGPAGRPSAS